MYNICLRFATVFILGFLEPVSKLMSSGFVGRCSLGTEQRGKNELKAQEKESKYKWDQKQADYSFPRSTPGSLVLNSVFQTSTASESP